MAIAIAIWDGNCNYEILTYKTLRSSPLSGTVNNYISSFKSTYIAQNSYEILSKALG